MISHQSADQIKLFQGPELRIVVEYFECNLARCFLELDEIRTASEPEIRHAGKLGSFVYLYRIRNTMVSGLKYLAFDPISSVKWNEYGMEYSSWYLG